MQKNDLAVLSWQKKRLPHAKFASAPFVAVILTTPKDLGKNIVQ